MRPFSILVSVAVLVALSALGFVTTRTAAQEATTGATPTAGISVIDLAPGVAVEVFGGAPSDRAPGQTVYLVRVTFHPGAEIFPHSHPGTTLISVESGTFGWTLLEGTAYVVRGAAAGAMEPTEEVTAPGTEVILAQGDAIYYEDDVIHSARNAGDDPAVVLVSLVLTSGEPLLMPVDMAMGTPAA